MKMPLGSVKDNMRINSRPELMFALASSLYVFKTLRIGPIGPEIVFFILLILLNHNYIFGSYYKKKILWYSLTVYLLAMILSLIGSINYYLNGNTIGDKNFFDLFAVTFSFAICIIYGSSEKFFNSINVLANTLFFLLILNALLLPINYNQEGGFQGFSGNANQIASFSIYTAIFCFLAVSKLSFLKGVILLGVGIATGIFARSDASLFFFLILFPISFFMSHIPIKIKGSYRVLFSLLVCIFAVLLMYSVYKAEVEFFVAAIDKIFRVRFALWGDYLTILEATYGLGFGTGKYASPVLGMMYGETEAHNTILDLSVSFGILTGIIGTSLIVYTLYASVRYISFSYAFIFSGLIVQSLVMTLYRHPLFWLLILATLAVASKNTNRKNTTRATNENFA